MNDEDIATTDRFSAETDGLADAGPPQLIELTNGDTYDLGIG